MTGSVGRSVASDTSGPQFEFSRWQHTVNIIEKQKDKKVAGNGAICVLKGRERPNLLNKKARNGPTFEIRNLNKSDESKVLMNIWERQETR